MRSAITVYNHLRVVKRFNQNPKGLYMVLAWCQLAESIIDRMDYNATKALYNIIPSKYPKDLHKMCLLKWF